MAVRNEQLFDPEVQHSLVRKIPNKSTKTKARASLPDILYLKVLDGRVGIFTQGPLPQATQFGPLEAPLATKNQMDEPNFLMKLDIRKCRRLESSASSYVYYDTTDENMCNWMILVQPAKQFPEQNLCAYQNEDFVYFTTTREIRADEELKVWYSPTYAKFMSAEVLTPTSGPVSVPKVNGGRQKAKKSKSTRRMQVYPNSLVLERDVRSIPPKKRGWKRTKRIDSEKPTISITPPPANKTTAEKIVKKKPTCDICSKAFKDRTKLRIHSVVHSQLRNFLCHHCGATFKRKDKLRDHIIKLHEKAKEVPKRPSIKSSENLSKFEFKCDICHIGFHRRGMLINHLQKRHPETQTEDLEQLNRPLFRLVRSFQCPYCNKAYKSNTKRKLHVIKHHPGEPVPSSLKRKKCEGTGIGDDKIFTERSIEAKPFKCPYCAMQYSMKHKMDKHIKEKHPEFYRKPEKQPAVSKQQRLPTAVNKADKTPEYNCIPTHIGQEMAQQRSAGAFEMESSSAKSSLTPETGTLVQNQPNDGSSSEVMLLSDEAVQKTLHDCHHGATQAPQPMTTNPMLPPVTDNSIPSRPVSPPTVLAPFNLSHNTLGHESDLETLSYRVSYVESGFSGTEQSTFTDLYNGATDVFVRPHNPVQNIQSGLATHDILGPDLRDLDAAQPTPASRPPQQRLNHNGIARSQASSRYPLGRKQILKTYENSQNQLLQLQNEADTHTQTRIKNMPYKARVLSSDWRSSWVTDRMPDPITELRQVCRANETPFAPLSSQGPPCVVRTEGTADPMLVDGQAMNREWGDNDDVTDLITVDRHYLYAMPDTEGT